MVRDHGGRLAERFAEQHHQTSSATGTVKQTTKIVSPTSNRNWKKGSRFIRFTIAANTDAERKFRWQWSGENGSQVVAPLEITTNVKKLGFYNYRCERSTALFVRGSQKERHRGTRVLQALKINQHWIVNIAGTLSIMILKAKLATEAAES